jgi:DNA-binding transcriptional ArsR family regulator
MLKYKDVDTSLRALADPTRRAIVERLSIGPASVTDIAGPFDLTLAAVVQHIQVLEESGIIRSEKNGRVRTCRLDADGLKPISDWVAQRRSMIERQLDRLGEILAEPEEPFEPAESSNEG